MRTGSALALRHSIGRQRIEVRVAREAGAHALMESVGELNRARFLPAIERVFDEFDRAGEVVRIGRLDLDLGRIGEGRLGDVEERLEAALRDALRQAFADRVPAALSTEAEEAQAVVQPTRLALLDAFSHYLAAGAWPYRSVLDPATAPAALFERLLEEAPEALAAMLRDRRGSEASVRRLVRQMPHALLERLLALLDPDSAHWILGYMAETRAAHAAEPLVAQAPEEFARTLWFVVLRDALRRAGLRANRRAFVAKLVADIAAAAGLDPGDLLRALRAGLAGAPSAARGDASLLSILAEIGGDAAAGIAAGPRRRSAIGEDAGEEDRVADIAGAFAALEAALAAGPAARLTFAEAAGEAARRLRPGGGSDEAAVRALLARLAAADGPALGRLLRRRSADSADWVVSGLLASHGPDEASELILAPHLAETAAGLISLARCDRTESAALIAAAAALPPSAPATLAVAELARLLASERGITEAALLGSLHAAALAAGGEARARMAPLLAEAREPGGRAQTAAVRRALAIDLLKAVLSGGPIWPPPDSVEAALASLAGMEADSIRRRAGAPSIAPRRAESALSRLTPRALARLIVLLAPRSGERGRVGAALAEARGDRARLAALAAALFTGAASGGASPASARAAALAAGGEARSASERAAVRTAAEARALARLAADLAQADRAGAGLALVSLVDGDASKLVLRLAAASAVEADRTVAERDLFFLVRANPIELVRRLTARAAFGATGRDGGSLPTAARARLRDRSGLGPLAAGAAGSDAALLALLFDRMGERERDEAKTLARLLSGPTARSSLGAELVLRSLLAAAAAAIAHGGRESFAELWRAELARSASPAKRHSLERLVPRGFAGTSAARRPPPPAVPERGSAEWLLALLEAPADEVRRELALLRSPALRRRLARRLPRHLLARLLFAARPREARALLAAAELARGVFAGAGRSLAPEQLWEALLAGATAPSGSAVRRLVERLVPPGADGDSLAAAMLARARAVRQAPLAAAVEELAAERGSARRASPPPARKPAVLDERSPFRLGEDEPIPVHNAGLAIAAPYLPALFERLGLVARGPEGGLAWVEPEAAGRGVHLLQYLVDGRTDAPEPFLALNKILCGLDPSWPALRAIEATGLERETCDSLLEAIIANWPLLQGSSVAALRETFLQREGRLLRAELGWKLEVERKTLDVLLEELPWSFSMILAPWMGEPLSVEW